MRLKYGKLFKTTKNWVFFKKISQAFQESFEYFKITQVSKFAVDYIWSSNIFKPLDNSVFSKKKDGFLNKNLEFFIITKGGEFAVDCDWTSKKSQNVQFFAFFKKNRWPFPRNKTLSFSKTLEVANLPYDAI